MATAHVAYEDGVVTNIQSLLEAFRSSSLPCVFAWPLTTPETSLPVYGDFWPG